MSITITITDALQEAGAAAAAAATGAASAQEYLQARAEELCTGYVNAYRVGTISSGDYVLRFTASENAAIVAAAETDAIVAGLLARVRESADVVLYADEVVQGVGYLVSEGLLTQARGAEILAY